MGIIERYGDKGVTQPVMRKPYGLVGLKYMQVFHWYVSESSGRAGVSQSR
jgi:hypothetical protein